MSSLNQSELHIGPRIIGPGHPPYIIAEAGVNHNGSVDTALKMVDAARAVGAHAVKFQAFNATRLASRFAEQAAYQKGSSAAPSQVEMLARLELQPDDFIRIKGHCDNVGIEFLATPFGVEDLRILVDLGVRAIKIASPDIINRPLLEAAAQSGLPILLSTGASEQGEIDQAYRFLCQDQSCSLVLLHCVSSYPTKLEQANLRRIAALHERYGCPVGFSDHTAEAFTGQLAFGVGANVLEKHFTLDRDQPGPDHAFSQNPEQLAEYINLARQLPPPSGDVRGCPACRHGDVERALGSGSLDLSEAEREVRRVSRCSVTAGRDIAAGVLIGRNMLVVKRPGTGITPWRIGEVAGRTAKQDIPADTPITWEMVQ